MRAEPQNKILWLWCQVDIHIPWHLVYVRLFITAMHAGSLSPPWCPHILTLWTWLVHTRMIHVNMHVRTYNPVTIQCTVYAYILYPKLPTKQQRYQGNRQWNKDIPRPNPEENIYWAEHKENMGSVHCTRLITHVSHDTIQPNIQSHVFKHYTEDIVWQSCRDVHAA